MTRWTALIAPLLAIIAAGLLMALPATAQTVSVPVVSPATAKAALAVHVVSEDGHLVRGAHVVLLTPDGKPLAVRLTNRHGRAVFAPVKPGNYIVRAGKPGQGKGQEKVVVEDGKLAKTVVHIKKP